MSWASRLPLRGVRFLVGSQGAKYPQTRLVVIVTWCGLLVAFVLGVAAWNSPTLAAQFDGWSAVTLPAQFATFTALLGLGLSAVWALGKYVVRPGTNVALGTLVDFIGDAAGYFDVAPRTLLAATTSCAVGSNF